jgi:hypothetical protein
MRMKWLKTPRRHFLSFHQVNRNSCPVAYRESFLFFAISRTVPVGWVLYRLLFISFLKLVIPALDSPAKHFFFLFWQWSGSGIKWVTRDAATFLVQRGLGNLFQHRQQQRPPVSRLCRNAKKVWHFLLAFKPCVPFCRELTGNCIRHHHLEKLLF